jgi:Co/Zn/Cd efflux system component
MSASCCEHSHGPQTGAAPGYRRVLWTALVVNAAMFAIEAVAGQAAGSAALKADALDFLGDAGNYAISLFVLGMAIRQRALAALLKAGSMGVFGLWVVGDTLYKLIVPGLPSAETMGIVGVLALVANVGVAALLYRYREGDANMRSVWLCTRNDAIGNVAVVLAAGAVSLTATGWPDQIVAAVMASLALTAAWKVSRQALVEIRHAQPAPMPAR